MSVEHHAEYRNGGNAEQAAGGLELLPLNLSGGHNENKAVTNLGGAVNGRRLLERWTVDEDKAEAFPYCAQGVPDIARRNGIEGVRRRIETPDPSLIQRF